MYRIISLSMLGLAFVATGCGDKKPPPVQPADQPTMMAPKDEKGNVKAGEQPKFNATP